MKIKKIRLSQKPAEPVGEHSELQSLIAISPIPTQSQETPIINTASAVNKLNHLMPNTVSDAMPASKNTTNTPSLLPIVSDKGTARTISL
jgi:hypothetical protein